MNALRTLILLTFSGLLGACGGSSTDSASANRSISIAFQAYAGSTPINCDATLQGLGSHGSDATLADFKLFVHNLRLVTDEGIELPVTLDEIDGWQTDGIALLDFQDRFNSCDGDNKPVNTGIHGQVSDLPVVISGIRFTVGVPVSHNHLNQATATAPLNTQAMFWSWQGGFKHMRFDVKPSGGVALSNGSTGSVWQFHLGDTSCSSDPVGSCEYRNRPQIELDSFVENSSAIRIDYAALVADSALGSDAGGAPGCMSGSTDPECNALFDNLGLLLGDAAGPAAAPTVFSIVLTP